MQYPIYFKYHSIWVKNVEIEFLDCFMLFGVWSDDWDVSHLT